MHPTLTHFATLFTSLLFCLNFCNIFAFVFRQTVGEHAERGEMQSGEEFHDDLQHEEELQEISNEEHVFGESDRQDNGHRPEKHVQQEEVR